MRVEMEQVEGRRFRIRARGVEVIVDDTVEAGGPGDGFRPTELLMGALAACMAGTMVTFADRQGIEIRALSIDVEDEVEKSPSRIGRLNIDMRVDAGADDRQVAALERVASACKIHNTLTRSCETELEFSVRT